jgi:hypothetical protein
VPKPGSTLGAKRIGDLWKDLGDVDAERAFKAVVALVDSPKEAVALIGERVKAVSEPDREQLAALVVSLGAEDFDTRERATRELRQLGGVARPAVTKLLNGSPSLEARRRAEELLGRFKSGDLEDADQLRAVRAVEVLEWAGTSEARAVLEALAKGATEARLTAEARSALTRLSESKRNAGR